MKEVSIWSRMGYLYPMLRTKIRREVAASRGVGEDAVLGVFKRKGFLGLHKSYQDALIKATELPYEDWLNGNLYLSLNEDTMKYVLKPLEELTKAQQSKQEVA